MDYNTRIVQPNDRFSKLAHRICVASRKNSPAVTIIPGGGKSFRSMDRFVWEKPILQDMMDGNTCEAPQVDGAGSKPSFFTLNGTKEGFRQLGREIIAMSGDDLAAQGGLPVCMLSNQIDVKQVTQQNWPFCKALLEGFGEALHEAGLILMTGETALMPKSITAFCDIDKPEQLVLTWSGTCLGLAPMKQKERIVTEDMVIVGLMEDGYRCTGGDALADIIIEAWGPDRDIIMSNPDASAFIEKLTIPSRSYAKTISRLNGWRVDGTLGAPLVTLYATAHVTGGGLWNRLAEILPEGVGAVLDNMPRSPLLLEVQDLSDAIDKPISDWKCHQIFHGGCGVLMICKEDDFATLKAQVVLDGHRPVVVGRTTRSKTGEILIDSRFSGGGTLSSLRPE